MAVRARPGDRPQVARPCPMCGCCELRGHFVYDRPPPGETQFPGFAGKDYWRELHRCPQCGHYLEWFEIDQAALYSGDYVTATYGDPAGVRRKFERINALAPEHSDNIGRVRHILGFCNAHWPADRFAARAPRLLDVGAGLGVFPYRMREAGWDCTALDMDPRLVAHHREVVGIRSEVADLRKAEGLGTFDLITFNKVLEHVADPVDVLHGALRLLAPRGLIYVELPDGEAAEAEGKEREEYLLGHVHVFSFASFALLVARAGVQLLACERLREPSTKFTLRGFARLATE
jgi:2-polyprenyl-3-methyl-5-hydroxy-6-metoxy-1,4-benzoquinol methylase